MQRFRVLMKAALLLYGALAVLVTGIVQAQTEEAPEKPHIALLLPLKSNTFGRLAETVRRGIEAGMAADAANAEKLPVLVYPTGDDNKQVIETYDRALRAGAQFVIGPMTKNAVQALAQSFAVSVPTLALSAPDSDVLLPDGMYALGVQLEAEARQVARIAAAQGKRRAVMVAADNPLSRRVSQAFADEWAKAGRLVVDQHQFTLDQARLKRMRDGIVSDKVDAIFFAIDGAKARQIRPYLGRTLPAYGTSQVNSAESTVLGRLDLSGLVFVDMPWLIAPDHAAVVSYPQPEGGFTSFEQARFYALGIDAWRLSQLLLGASYNEIGMLDGVSGYVSPGPARVFKREGLPAQMTQTGLRLLEEHEYR